MTFWAAKVHISFEITKKSLFFSLEISLFFQKYSIFAATKDIFTENFKKVENFSTADFDSIITQTLDASENEDEIILKELILNVIIRSANLSAEAIYAAISYAEKEKGEFPVCITCNGSTFWKTPLLRETVKARLSKLLQQPFEIIKIDDDITAGSFAAAFID